MSFLLFLTGTYWHKQSYIVIIISLRLPHSEEEKEEANPLRTQFNRTDTYTQRNKDTSIGADKTKTEPLDGFIHRSSWDQLLSVRPAEKAKERRKTTMTTELQKLNE